MPSCLYQKLSLSYLHLWILVRSFALLWRLSHLHMLLGLLLEYWLDDIFAEDYGAENSLEGRHFKD